MSKMPWATAWIVGASAGLGAETAKQLADRGVYVTISARSTDKLAALTAGREGQMTSLPLDIADYDACKAAVDSFDTLPDLVLLNAAIYDPMAVKNYDAKRANEIMTVNYGGVCNLLDCIMPVMTERKGGHIGLVASINGFVGLPLSAAYGPTKAAIHNLAEAIYPELEAKSVKLTVVNPGFIKTQLTAKNKFQMPQLMTPRYAADKMIKGLAKQRFEVIFPYPLARIVKLLGDLPRGILFSITRKMVKQLKL